MKTNPEKKCKHKETWFSRSIEPCEHNIEGMHDYCSDCGKCMDGHNREPNPEPKEELMNQRIDNVKNILIPMFPLFPPCSHGKESQFRAKDGIRCGQCFMDECIYSRDEISRMEEENKKLINAHMDCCGDNSSVDKLKSELSALREELKMQDEANDIYERNNNELKDSEKAYAEAVKILKRNLSAEKEKVKRLRDALEGMFNLLDSKEPVIRQMYLKNGQDALKETEDKNDQR